MPPATRFFDRLLNRLTEFTPADIHKRYEDRSQSLAEQIEAYRRFKDMLLDPNTKRIVFDARQAQIFNDIDEEIPAHMAGRVHLPFDQFYLEFTEPIAIAEQEPGHVDLARAYLVSSEALDITINGITLPGRTITLFLMDETGGLVDRTWHFSLDTGIALTRCGIARQETDPSEVPESWKDSDYLPCAQKIAEAPDRYIGWWERVTADYTSLFMWMMAYLMAKSVTLIEEPMSRQVRRWYEAHKELPRPWHVVYVEPKFYAVGTDPEAKGTGTQHSYRYDVIGHLRFGRHKTRDGYSETIEWVPPHQRGIANTVYIPKTYKVEHGKQISPRMREYFQEPPP